MIAVTAFRQTYDDDDDGGVKSLTFALERQRAR